MERYDSSIFWVQIHDLPFSFMSNEVAFSIKESLGDVIPTKDLSELSGSNFMRVRVAIDITKPLCRGRESHGTRNHKVRYHSNISGYPTSVIGVGSWLQSNGTLLVEDQQFGPWIQATQLNQMKKTTIEMQGFEENVQRSKALSNGGAKRPISIRDVSPVINVQTKDQSAVVLPEVTSESGPVTIIGVTKPNHAVPDFEEALQDLGESINAFSRRSNADLNISNHHEEKREEMTLLEVLVLQAKNPMILNDRLRKSSGLGNLNELISVGSFHVGWTAGDGDKKGRKEWSPK